MRHILRFNGYDGRLDRELEAVVLVMEAFEGFENKLQYDIIGHSGESPSIPFVKMQEPPKNNKEKLDVIRVILYYCLKKNYRNIFLRQCTPIPNTVGQVITL